ncbi:MAG TPA: hypothetical protein VM096_19565 [Vicinamibacterales bacterium]|nr:hypothetical protein [Vicinamibacterales bacterium]
MNSTRSVALVYAALSVALTWPLVLGIGSDVPGDLGDSLLNMWILGWGAEHVPRLLIGSIGWSEFWNANIFHPDPLALALSEHLFGQVLQILPVYWLTGNIILCYNLLFVSTFALSAFGTYLLVRDLTGDKRAAFIAGLIYGFLPYRIASIPHLQVMSSQWMPFALYGINRFVTTGSTRALIGGTAALVMQNWSCGYYLLYFAPFVPLFALHRMWTQGTFGHRRTWLGLGAAAATTLLLTLPFLFPYQEAQRVFGIERPFGEIVQFSANVWSYLTASENLKLFGKVLRFYPHGEGETFLGFVPWLLASVAVASLVRTAFRKDASVSSVPPWLTYVSAFLLVIVLAQLIGILSVVFFGGFELGLIRARTPQRLIIQLAIALALLLAISPRARLEGGRIARSPIALAFTLTILAMWLSLGPQPNAGERYVSGFGLYGLLYEYVPGFNGVRVPARYAMIAGLFLAILSGYGYRALSALRIPHSALIAIAVLILMEGAAIPLEINRTWSQNEAMPPAGVMSYSHAPPVYARVRELPAGTALTEFPFGDAAWEIRYVYYAASHWKPVTNGYSGSFPPNYKERVARLHRISQDPEAAWMSLTHSGSTHAVVHRNAFANVADADTVENWLKAHGATEIARFPDGDLLFKL